MSYAVVTFGCRVNQADSLEVEAALASRGARTSSPECADVVLVNTCSVTASADQAARQTIRRIHRQNPRAKIVVTGCYASRCAADVAALPGVAAVVSNAQKDRLVSMLPMIDTAEPDGPCGQPLGPGLMGRTAWTLRVQTGCDEPCSYCVIPSTRGTSRSRTRAEIGEKLRRVLEAGYKEIVVTGVHLGAWGRDLDPRATLAALLRDFAAVPGVFRVRVSSLEPMDCTAEVLDVLTGHPERFAAHLHLPLQHASDRLLRTMRRPYDRAAYAALVDGVRRRWPDAAIGSDLIVGFPGETDADAEALAEYLESSPLTHLHVFPYSDRPGTEASSLPDKVHGAAVKARAERLRAISRALHQRFRRAQTGRVRPALTIDDGSIAVTDNYVRVRVGPGHARNTWMNVTIPPPDDAADAAPL